MISSVSCLSKKYTPTNQKPTHQQQARALKQFFLFIHNSFEDARSQVIKKQKLIHNFENLWVKFFFLVGMN
jgi:hypothetical protein